MSTQATRHTNPHEIMDFAFLHQTMTDHIAGVHTDKPLPTEVPDDPEPYIEGDNSGYDDNGKPIGMKVKSSLLQI